MSDGRSRWLRGQTRLALELVLSNIVPGQYLDRCPTREHQVLLTFWVQTSTPLNSSTTELEATQKITKRHLRLKLLHAEQEVVSAIAAVKTSMKMWRRSEEKKYLVKILLAVQDGNASLIMKGQIQFSTQKS